MDTSPSSDALFEIDRALTPAQHTSAEEVLGEQTTTDHDPYWNLPEIDREPPMDDEEEEIVIAYTHEVHKVWQAMGRALEKHRSEQNS